MERFSISGTFIFAFAAPAVNDSELDKRCVLCYTENATNPMIARFLRGAGMRDQDRFRGCLMKRVFEEAQKMQQAEKNGE